MVGNQNNHIRKPRQSDEYNHLFLNIEELEKTILNIKDTKNKREEELYKRDKKFSKSEIELDNSP